MLGASAVVFVRYLFDCLDYLGDEPLPVARWLEWARKLGVPHYYFLDDNLMTLSREEAYRAAWGAFTDERLREELRSFSGVLLSSAPLIDYFKEHGLHDRIFEFPPIGGAGLRRGVPARDRAGDRPLRLAYFGGGHRVGPLEQWVLPAVARVAAEKPVELLVTVSEERASGIQAFAESTPGVRFTWLPFSLSYEAALRRLADHAPDVLLHPSSVTANNRYKTLNVLLNALDLGAIPLVSDTPPYDGLRGHPALFLCADDPESWAKSLRAVRDDPFACEPARRALLDLCAERFDGRVNAGVLTRILASHPCPGPALREARARRAVALSLDSGAREVEVAAESSAVPGPTPAGLDAEISLSGETIFSEAVPRPGWCGLAVRLGPTAALGGGRLTLRILSPWGETLREAEAGLSGRGGGDWVRFDFEPLANAPGRELQVALEPDGDASPCALCADGSRPRTRLWFATPGGHRPREHP